MTAGADGSSIGNMSMARINKIIMSLKDQAYQPDPARRTYIAKKNMVIMISQHERFLRLIRKFINAGYLEDRQFHKTYSGTPQGGIISPILANIYLDKLDTYMKEYAEKFSVGIRRTHDPEYTAIQIVIISLCHHSPGSLIATLNKGTQAVV